MRQIDPELQACLDAGATTLCRCWRVRRKDGVVLGFTDHDGRLRFEETDFAAQSGLDASALQVTNGLAVDNAQAVGALSDTSINEDDLRSGRFDGAEVDHWLVDWRNPERRVHLFRGSIGEVRRGEASFEAELRGLSDRLNVPIGRTIKRSCDRVIGDGRCGIDLHAPAYRHDASVSTVAQAGRIETYEVGDFASGWFGGGVLRWLSGRNEGLASVVRSEWLQGNRRVFRLASEPPLPVAEGDAFRVTAGCDKRAETCREKFSNFLNFRGFPHIPGEDWVVAYPRKGEAHDGSSLQRR